MENVPKLGRLIGGDNVQRDAVHIAVAPVIAGENLKPGTRIGFTGLEAFVVSQKAKKQIGIVDPYLLHNVVKGERFYMFLFPNTITSLRHDWSHPEFAKEDESSTMDDTFFKLRGDKEAEEWINDFADRIGSTYSEIMSGADDYQTSGDYLVRGGTFEGMSIPEEFWDMYERVKRITVEDRGSFLSCSC
jgi:hypothetical protein